MLKISSLQYFLLLFYASLTVTHRVAYNGVLFHESSDATIVSDEYIYVPIGHSVELPCVAREKTHQMHIDYKKADWRYYTRYGRKMTSSYGIRYDKRIDRFHFNDTTSFLSARFLQAIHNNTMLECWIPIGYQEPVRYVVSRFRIIIQDCGVEDNVFLNLMNPCAFGKCSVRNLTKGLHDNVRLLECHCLQHYTGIFCQQEVGNAFAYLFGCYSYNLIWIFTFLGFLVSNRFPKTRVALKGHPLRKTEDNNKNVIDEKRSKSSC